MYKFLLISTLTLFGFIPIAKAKNVPVVQNENFNFNWQFYKSVDTSMLPPSTVKWEMVDLPHTANIEQLTVKNQWQGICFYQKEFKLDKRYKGKNISLQFDAAMNEAVIWVNGQKIQHHLGGYLPFVVELTNIAHFDAVNTILVRLDNRDNPITGPKPLKILDFNMYGGIYRNVHLLVKEQIHISNPINANVIAGGGVFFSTTTASKEKASFEIKTHIENQSDKAANIVVSYQLIDKQGKVATQAKSSTSAIAKNSSVEIKQTGNLLNPKLWSPNEPNLYTLKTEVLADGKVVDIQYNKIGLRTINIKPEGMWINGKKTFLRGVNRHQEYPYVGYAISDAAQYRDAYKIKQSGFDFVRCSHYPMSPAFLDACDELGIMVLDAILGWQYFGDKQFQTFALRSSRDLIRRDRNHPSVFAWELSINETDMPKAFTDSANLIAHEEYPYNSCYSAGWLRQSYDVYIEARQHRHGLHPELPLLVSEYGDWEYFAQNAGFNQQDWKDLLEIDRTSRQPREAGEKRLLQQALNIQEAHNDNLSTHAFADGYWVMFDYNRGVADEQEYSGIMDIFRLPKFSHYFFKSQRNIAATNFGQPMLFIASYWQPKESQNVRIFSNCEEVELFVDGKSVGRKKPDSNSISKQLNHAPFTFNVSCTKPGTLKAIGYNKGIKVSEEKVSTASTPDHIEIQIDESGKKLTQNDVLFVYAYIKDAANTTAHNDSREVTFQVKGAQIIGPSSIHAQAGIATLLIRTNKAASDISITATANDLKSASSHSKIK